MILVISLFLLFVALSLILSARILIWLTIAILPDMLFKLGSILILSAFVVLAAAGLLLMIKIIGRSIRQYFSTHQRLKRRLLFIRNRQHRVDRLFHFRKLHINYFHVQHKKRLAKANDRKHIRSLSQAIRKDLLAREKTMPSTTLKQLQQEHARYRASRDGEALLMLQQKIFDMART